MNPDQRRVVVVCGVLLAVSLLFPPWEKTTVSAPPLRWGGSTEPSITMTGFDGYGFIGSSRFLSRVSLGHLILQCVVIGIGGAAVYFACGQKKP